MDHFLPSGTGILLTVWASVNMVAVDSKNTKQLMLVSVQAKQIRLSAIINIHSLQRRHQLQQQQQQLHGIGGGASVGEGSVVSAARIHYAVLRRRLALYNVGCLARRSNIEQTLHNLFESVNKHSYR